MKKTLRFVAGMVAGALLASMLLGLGHRHSRATVASVVADTVTVTKTDTLLLRLPPPLRDSVVVRYITRQLPAAPTAVDSSLRSAVDAIAARATEVATVSVPIVQRQYADSNYHAWVSGYHARLDSIEVFPATTTLIINQRQKRARWHLGIQAGTGLTPRGPQPYVGIGITYSLASF